MSSKPLCSPTELLLSRPSPFGLETCPLLALGTYQPGQETIDFVKTQAKVLVIGAGGLGCEILKNLALSGIQNIDVIDMDTIDVTNLNRQFLFRVKDVGGKKAEVAANFIMKRCPNVKVTAHTCKIQDFPSSFYQQFTVVIGGLDNIEARRWLNALLHEMVEEDEEGNIIPSTAIPYIDGGSEAFKGQARMIVPFLTACFDCSLDLFPPQQVFQLCTIAETPRKPEHCIAYALLAVNQGLAEGKDSTEIRQGWEQKFGEKTKLDKDQAEHMVYIYEKAKERAIRFKIDGVTLQLTSGVVKHIIPAIASTNAVVAAMCCNEAWKYLGYASQLLDTYVFYNGNQGLYTHSYRFEKKEDCLVCSRRTRNLSIDPQKSLQFLMNQLQEVFNFTKPSLGSSKNRNIYMQGPESLRKASEANLQKKISDLLEDGDILTVTDPLFPMPVDLCISFLK